MKASRLNP